MKLGLWSVKTVEPRVNAQTGCCEIVFSQKQSDDVDQLYSRWKSLGVSFAQEPTDMDFGYTFVALDPDGNRIRIFFPQRQ